MFLWIFSPYYPRKEVKESIFGSGGGGGGMKCDSGKITFFFVYVVVDVND